MRQRPDAGRYFLLGTSHGLASGPVREELHGHLRDARKELAHLVHEGRLLHEAAFLVTCGRLELYGVAPDPHRLRAHLERYLGRQSTLPPNRLAGVLRFAVDDQAVEHLFRVASGLESAIQGEVQILGQVRRMLDDPRDEETRGPRLHRLVETAVSTGKRVRAETRIGRGAASMAGAALEMLAREAGGLRELEVLVLGAGETGSLVGQLLVKEGARLTVANRTLARAVAVAERLGGKARSLDDLAELLPQADVVVGSVGEVGYLVTRTTVESLRDRGGGAFPRWYLDLAHPRNFDPDLALSPGVRVLDLGEIEETAKAARDARAAEIPRAEAIVAEEIARFQRWLSARAAVPQLRAVREQVLTLALTEAERYARGLDEGERDRLHRFARSLARTILHRPTVALREADPATDDGRSIHQAAEILFGLDELPGIHGNRRESA